MVPNGSHLFHLNHWLQALSHLAWAPGERIGNGKICSLGSHSEQLTTYKYSEFPPIGQIMARLAIKFVFAVALRYLCGKRWNLWQRKKITIRSSAAEYLTYIASVGDHPLHVELRYEDENIWLTQRLMSELYGVEVSTVNEHIATIFRDRELTREATFGNSE